MYYCYLETPVGELLLAGNGETLKLIGFPEGPMRRSPEPRWKHSEAVFARPVKQLREYFAGRRKQFDLQMEPHGTEFQLAVLEELKNIPYGTTATYADIARNMGRPGAARAVGAANGRNPLPIVIPCHRVVGSDGGLTGFGGGIATKKALLDLERSFA